MQIRESAENYLETILVIQRKKGSVRSIDVARHLDFSKPSVSRAMALLKGSGYVVIDGDGQIHLTDSGREIAERIYERHELFTNWLVMLGVDPETAAADACKIEHDISAESFERIKTHILEEHPNFQL